MAEALLEVVVAPLFSTRLASVGPRKPRMLDRLLLSPYVLPREYLRNGVLPENRVEDVNVKA